MQNPTSTGTDTGILRRTIRLVAVWVWMTLLSLGLISIAFSSISNVWIIALTPFIVNGWLVSFTRRGALRYFHNRSVAAARKSTTPSGENDEPLPSWRQWLKSSSHSHALKAGFRGADKFLSSPPPGWFKRRIIWTTTRFRTGFQNWLGVTVWTLPGLAMMWFGWYSGWQISFHKMYEYSAVGFTMTFLGWVLLAFSLPLALMGVARFSLSEDWKVFFQVRRNWRWVRRAGWRNLLLGLIFLIASAPVGVNYVVFYFWPQIIDLPPNIEIGEIKSQVFIFYFSSTLVILMPVWMVTRYLIGHVYYAPTVIKWLKNKRVAPDELSRYEIEWLTITGYPVTDCLVHHSDHYKVPFWGKGISPTIRLGFIIITLVTWMGFGFLINLAQFARYSGLEGWFNHPMIHNPHYYYTPNLDPSGSDFRPLQDNPAFRDLPEDM